MEKRLRDIEKKYGYLLRIIPMKYMKSTLYINNQKARYEKNVAKSVIFVTFFLWIS